MIQESTLVDDQNVNNFDFPSIYQEQIFKSKYARWIDELGRREHWSETVNRYLDQLERQVAKLGLAEEVWQTVRPVLYEHIANHKSMPSMRALMTAGPALERDNVAAYNCSAVAIRRPEAFDEALYILCCGTGVGFSVEQKYVQQLPEVPSFLTESNLTIMVEDSKIGWASGLRQLIRELYQGGVPKWDVSRVRPAGSRLHTFGGRASGPAPLVELFEYVVKTFKEATGRKLTSAECHGIMCKIGEIVVVGGVRRSALISLSDPDDAEMRDIKSSEWWVNHPEYALANNSAVWEGKPDENVFWDEWKALERSGSGERGIINRQGMQEHVRSNFRRDPNHSFLTNPCSEIILRDCQLCNLSEVVARADDTIQSLERKVRAASIMGTIQSSFTDFRYLSDEWKQNCEEERLLGVSITGIMDCPLLNDASDPDLPERLGYLQECVIEENTKWAQWLGINPSTATTAVKPSGNLSQLVDSASGIHPRFSEYYVRTNRGTKIDPISQFLYMSGIPTEDDVMQPDRGWVFSYPIKSPEGAITRHDLTAIDQLKLWLIYAQHWCEHKPSITVYVRDHEWNEVGTFVYDHFDKVSGVSFLPFDNGTYQQAPYTECSKEEYEALLTNMPEVLNWDLLSQYEQDDWTTGAQELACVAGQCEI